MSCTRQKSPNVIARSVSWSADSQFLFAAVAETETDIVLFDGLLE
jgi:hypothetical protein